MTAAREKRRVVWLPRVAVRVRLEPQDLPDGVDARPQLARDAFGHDRHRGACAPLGLREAASAHEIDAEDAEVFRRDELVRDGRLASRAVGKRGAPAQPARPRGRNRGDRRLALHDVEDGPPPLLVQDAHIDDIGRADTGIDCRCRPRAAQEDGSADEEQHGSGHLKRDERIPGAAGTGITHHLAANRPHQLQARGLKRRREREEQGRDHRAGHQEQRDAPVRRRHGETNVAEVRRPGARHRVDDGFEHEP